MGSQLTVHFPSLPVSRPLTNERQTLGTYLSNSLIINITDNTYIIEYMHITGQLT